MKLPNTYLGNHVKGQIVVEECDESEFWLQLILDKELISKEEVIPVLKEGNELTSIFVVSRKTASMNLKVN